MIGTEQYPIREGYLPCCIGIRSEGLCGLRHEFPGKGERERDRERERERDCVFRRVEKVEVAEAERREHLRVLRQCFSPTI
jgi:hypothetical protein